LGFPEKSWGSVQFPTRCFQAAFGRSFARCSQKKLSSGVVKIHPDLFVKPVVKGKKGKYVIQIASVWFF